jgi:hypothetical protein
MLYKNATMSVVTPLLRDSFLAKVVQQFNRRRKAIAHRGGTLELETLFSELEGELLTVRFRPNTARPVLILEFLEKNRFNLYIRSTLNRTRGKILVRIDAGRIIGNANKVVQTFEWTLSTIWQLDSTTGHDERLAELISARWSQLLVQAVEQG